MWGFNMIMASQASELHKNYDRQHRTNKCHLYIIKKLYSLFFFKIFDDTTIVNTVHIQQVNKLAQNVQQMYAHTGRNSKNQREKEYNK